MGMGAFAEEKWTAERIKALPDDGNRYEVVDGELYVSPAPRLLHQWLLMRLAGQLLDYVLANGIGIVVPAPADIEFADDTLVQPDISVIPAEDGKLPVSWREVDRLLLAVEVLSPRTAEYDRGVKRLLYLRQRVGEYWIVDAESRLIERWISGRQQPFIETVAFEWRPIGGIPPLQVDVARLYAKLPDSNART